MKNIPIYEPSLEGNERKYLLDCIDTVWISSQGKYIRDFELQLASYHDMQYGIATSNCTTALHLAILALGLGEGDEIICPNLTFIAPANMILLSNAKLVLVDIESDTLAMSPSLIEKSITPKTKAIIVVHQFGHAAPMDEIMDIAKRYDLKVIEDNAESIGGRYKGKLLGTFGDLSCFSFFGNKIITSGEGGAILTNNPALAVTCKELRDHGMATHQKYLHVAIGFNYRMTNMQAAIGLAQLERLDYILGIRKKQMDLYYSLLEGTKGIKLREFQNWCDPVHWLMTLTLDTTYDRNEVIKSMKEKGVECRPMINPVHHALYLKDKYQDKQFPVAINISSRSLHLPSSNNLTQNEIEYIVSSFKEVIN